MTEQFYIFCDNKLVEVTMSLSRATDVAAQLRKLWGGAFKDKVKVKSYLVDVHEVQLASDKIDGLAGCLDYLKVAEKLPDLNTI